MSDATPPAGYYPDPAGSGHQRYWDGAQWTSHLVPGQAPAPTPVVPSVTAARLAALAPFRAPARTAILPDVGPVTTLVRKRPPLRISRIAFGVFVVVGSTVAAYVNTQPLGATASPAAVHASR
ncbi:MAG TPA: DUF2510 domain-containing protein [Mycobacteriales bacterium]|nr:DUF2510 domain-containing protein [Mycobacteriales bacterium]HWA66151.1 DUF2510 domain-containing protein [Mycobacteriales bacterium]